MQEQLGCERIGDSVWVCEAHTYCEQGFLSVSPNSFYVVHILFFFCCVKISVVSATCLTECLRELSLLHVLLHSSLIELMLNV